MTAALRLVTDGAASPLAECERVIARGLRSFVEVGQALARIRDERLYKGEYDTFEAYCKERWDLDRAYAYETIQASETVRVLSGIPDSPVPANPGQARALKGLEPGEAQEVMEAAHAATSGKITAAAIKEARKEYEGSTPDKDTVPDYLGVYRAASTAIQKFRFVDSAKLDDQHFNQLTSILDELVADIRQIKEIHIDHR